MRTVLTIASTSLSLAACSHAATPSSPTVVAKPNAAKPTATGTLTAIDVYGSKHVSDDEILATAALAVGDNVAFGPELFGLLDAAKQRLTDRFHFAFIEMSPISYFGDSRAAGKIFVTIDLVDADDAARLDFMPEPTRATADPAGLVTAWLDYEQHAWPLLHGGNLRPSVCTAGWYCGLGFGHPDLEQREGLFIANVPTHVAELTTVLREDRDEKRRAAAAQLLAYAKDREQVIDAIVPSLEDPDFVVRNNVMLVLAAIQQKADTIVVPLPAILHAMTHPTTTDRNKAAITLSAIAKLATPAVRKTIAREVGDILVAMAAMKQPNNHDAAIGILKTLSGQDHGDDAAAWRSWLATYRGK